MRKLLAIPVIVLLAFASSYSQSLNDSLVAWYTFMGNANDMSGNGNTGTVYGATLTSDRFGTANSAYNFNGTSNYIDIGSPTKYNFSQQVTLSAWIEVGVTTGYTFIDGWNYNGNAGWIFGIDSNPNPGIRFTLRTTGSTPTVSVLSPVPSAGWHFIVGTYDGLKARVFVDGVLKDSVAMAGSIIPPNDYMTIGAYRWTQGIQQRKSYFKGRLDDIRIYKRALSLSEIGALYTLTTGGLVAWYPFTGNANDASGNGLNGTVSGATLTTDRFGNANSAYSFNGTNNYIDIGNYSNYNFTTQLTLSTWVEFGTARTQTFIDGWNYNGNAGWGLSQIAVDGLQFVIRTTNATPILNVLAPAPTSGWHLVTGTYDGTIARLYVDAVQVQTTSSVGAIVPPNDPMSIGAYRHNYNQSFVLGKLDDIRIYNKALSPLEITNIFNEGGSPNNAPGFVNTPDTNATEDIAWSYAVTAVDVDAGDFVTLTLPVKPAGMTLSGNTISWTPTNSNVGLNNVTVRATDNHGAFSEQVFRVRVANINDSPSITSAAPTAAVQSQLFSYQAQASDPDVGDVINWTLTTAPTGMTVSTTGLITWTPTPAQVGSNNVVLRVKDAANVTAQQSFSITVTNVNDAPVITDPAAQTATEDIPYTLTLAATDPDGNQVFWFKVQGPDSLKVNQNTGVITWTPLQNVAGSTVQVKIRATDAVLSDTTTFNITVTAVNDPPVIMTIIPNTFKMDSLYSIPLTANDEEGNAITWTVTKKPSTMNIVSNVLVWVPITAGLDTIVLVASDGSNADTLISYVQVTGPMVGTSPLSIRAVPSMLTLSSISKQGSTSLMVGLPSGSNSGTVRIYNMSGRIVESHNLSGIGWHSVSLKNHSTGVLLARISAGGKTIEKRIISR